MKEDKGKSVGDKKRASSWAKKKALAQTFENRESHTIEYTLTKIVKHRYWEVNKSLAVLRGFAAKKGITVPFRTTAVVLWLHNSSSLKKNRKHTQWVGAPVRVQVQQETPDLTRPAGKGGKSQKRMASDGQNNRQHH